MNVLADTSVWIRYLRRGERGSSAVLDELLEAGRALVCGPVLAELLTGMRADQREHAWLALGSLPWAELDHEGWRLCGGLAGELRQRGASVPLTDVVIAAAAIRAGASIWSFDTDFSRMAAALPEAGLEIFEP